MKLTIDTTIIEGTQAEVFNFLEFTGILGQLRKATSFEPEVDLSEEEHDVCCLTKGIENPEQFLKQPTPTKVSEFDIDDVVQSKLDILAGRDVVFKETIGIVKDVYLDDFDRTIYEVVFVTQGEIKIVHVDHNALELF